MLLYLMPMKAVNAKLPVDDLGTADTEQVLLESCCLT
jgi:hypothetical protein